MPCPIILSQMNQGASCSNVQNTHVPLLQCMTHLSCLSNKQKEWGITGNGIASVKLGFSDKAPNVTFTIAAEVFPYVDVVTYTELSSTTAEADVWGKVKFEGTWDLPGTKAQTRIAMAYVQKYTTEIAGANFSRGCTPICAGLLKRRSL